MFLNFFSLLEQADHVLLLFFYGVSSANVFIQWCAVFFGEFALWILGVSFFLFWHLRAARAWAGALGGGICALIVNAVLGIVFFRPRPFITFELVPFVQSMPDSKSFPSDHTALAFACATSIYAADRQMGKIAYAIAALVGMGRVLSGVHYPFDVVVGAFIGSICAWYIQKNIFHKYL